MCLLFKDYIFLNHPLMKVKELCAYCASIVRVLCVNSACIVRE